MLDLRVLARRRRRVSLLRGAWLEPDGHRPRPSGREAGEEVTDLFLVTEEHIPVEEVKSGMRLILPGGGRVTVERVDVYETLGVETVENFVIRWTRGGKDIGSFQPHLRGETVKVDRRRG